MNKIIKYLKEVSIWLLWMFTILTLIMLFGAFVLWDFDSLSGDRLWNENTFSLLRIIIAFSFLLPILIKLRVDFVWTNQN